MGRKAREKLIRLAVEPRVETAIEAAPPAAGEWSWREWTIVAFLAAITIAVFRQIVSHAFLNFDDGQFIYENKHVLHGDIGWALTSAEIGWYPLTWLSHMQQEPGQEMHPGALSPRPSIRRRHFRSATASRMR